MTPLELYGLNKVKLYTHNKVSPRDCPAPSLAFGLELELEHTGLDSWYVAGLHGARDDSLRNDGWEYKTMPATHSIVMDVLERFFNKWEIGHHNYSERTSTHVHINCQEMHFSQIASLVATYQVFEKMLFKFAGADRDKNIFCVPLSECVIAYNAPRILAAEDWTAIDNVVRRWQKYAALNLLTLNNFGTIEFRHMPGTHNLRKIEEWLHLLGCLYNFSISKPYDEVIAELTSLNTTSAYRGILDIVFGKYAKYLEDMDYMLDIEEGVLNLKYSILNPKGVKKSLITNMWFDDAPEPNDEDDLRLRAAIAQDRLRAQIAQHSTSNILRDWLQVSEAPHPDDPVNLFANTTTTRT